MANRICIKLVRSTIGQKPKVVATVRSLGLKKLNSTVEHDTTDPVLGMVNAVKHLVEVKEIK
ncbi:MAG: 50S ribosomal protein L30 [Spirochaetales bacterium]|jgi:large subunit ribosomal protein L30|nr:50S ribosomal protein L30 [Spirochaetales bacterium]HNQ98051.1 50S ribosomal protein L30 [Treponemataceae bacterium]